MNARVYLAGPILHESDGGANEWRRDADEYLARNHILGISPLRNERPHGPKYDFQSLEGGGPNAIPAKNYFDVLNCDLTLAYLPKWSAGTLLEIGWAKAHARPVVLVTQDPIFMKHPVLQWCCGWHYETLKEGLAAVVGLLSGYVGGKNV